MPHHVVLFVGGPLHNELYAFEEPLRPFWKVAFSKIKTVCNYDNEITNETNFSSETWYELGHLNKFPVYIHKPLIPHDIKHN